MTILKRITFAIAMGAVSTVTLNATAETTFHKPAGLRSNYAPSTVIIKLRSDKIIRTDQQREAFENQFAADVLKSLSIRLTRITTLSSGATHFEVYRGVSSTVSAPGVAANRLTYPELWTFIEALKKLPSVEYAESGGNGTIQYTPNDPGFINYQKAYLGTTNGGANIEQAWDISQGNPINVAVVDSGVVRHTDFVSSDGTSRVLPGCDTTDTTNQCGNKGIVSNAAADWHGAKVAGIMMARMNNGLGIAGINGQARLIPVKVTTGLGTFNIPDAANGILWAAGIQVGKMPLNSNPAKVINVSLGHDPGPCTNTYQDAIDKARATGAIIVVAAGNERSDASQWQPANCKNVVVVAAMYNENWYSESNFGSNVTLSAPGVAIHSTTAKVNSDGSLSYIFTYDEAAAGITGTSFASPHVAGALSLMLAYRNDLSADQAIQTIKDTVTPYPRGFRCGSQSDQVICGAGMLNIGAAMKKWRDIPSTVPTCTVSVNATSIPYDASSVFTINGTLLPAGSTAYWYGTKNGVNDVSNQYAGVAPGQYTYVNSPGMEGKYIRRAQIRNTQNQTICTTNDVSVEYLAPIPSCSLSVNSSDVPTGASFAFTVSATNVPANAQGYWSGTKNGVGDTSNQFAGSAPGVYTYTNSEGSAGTYYRYMQIRSGSNLICTTNGVFTNLR